MNAAARAATRAHARKGRGTVARPAAACAAAAVAATLLAGCGSSDSGTGPPPTGSEGSAAPEHTTVGIFLPPEIASNAFTYNTDLVPANSTAAVSVTAHRGQTAVSLSVTGLQARRGYGAHAQTQPCGADPADSGHNYQNVPGAGPTAVNADNELWLDFTTDREGKGHANRTAGWSFRPGEARSVVLFDHLTSTNADDPGNAGARVACLDVDF